MAATVGPSHGASSASRGMGGAREHSSDLEGLPWPAGAAGRPAPQPRGAPGAGSAAQASASFFASLI